MEVKHYSELGALPAGYGPLFEAAEKESFFNGVLWYRALLATTRTTGEEQHFFGLEEEGSGRPLALLPMRASAAERGPWGARLLSGCHSVYAMEFSPLLSPEIADRKAAIHALVGALASTRPRWDVVSLRLLDRSSDVFDHFLGAFRTHGMTTEPYFQFGHWSEEVAGRSFEEYLAGRGKSIRKTVARAVRHFDDRSDGRYELLTGEGDLNEAIADFEEVYEASWKGEEAHPAFMGRLIQDCAAQGSLRLANLYLNGRPVATWLVIFANGTAVLLKTAYDISLPANLSAGGVLTYKVIRHLIDVDKASLIDFGIGDESYKTKWMSKRGERWGIMAYNRHTPKGVLLSAAMGSRELARRLLKRFAFNLKRSEQR